MADAANRSRTENNKFKRVKFAKTWVSTETISSAARMAGISESSARKFLEEDSVQKLIEQERIKIAKRLDLDADFVLQEIQAIAMESRAEKNHKDALKALELLGKHLKLFSDRETHTGATVQFNLSLDGKQIDNNSVNTLEHSADDHELDFDIPEELKTLSPEELDLVGTYEKSDNPSYSIFDLNLGTNDEETND
tara:strand:- start:5011 stop:5595 length:585 start_codon:yes stop_codon:yes gene_type:complete